MGSIYKIHEKLNCKGLILPANIIVEFIFTQKGWKYSFYDSRGIPISINIWNKFGKLTITGKELKELFSFLEPSTIEKLDFLPKLNSNPILSLNKVQNKKIDSNSNSNSNLDLNSNSNSNSNSNLDLNLDLIFSNVQNSNSDLFNFKKSNLEQNSNTTLELDSSLDLSLYLEQRLMPKYKNFYDDNEDTIKSYEICGREYTTFNVYEYVCTCGTFNNRCDCKITEPKYIGRHSHEDYFCPSATFYPVENCFYICKPCNYKYETFDLLIYPDTNKQNSKIIDSISSIKKTVSWGQIDIINI